MRVPLKLDITTGDKITPEAIEYSYSMMFSDDTLEIFAYNLETILAEKLKTVISRGDQNTRPRDYYDIFILSKLKGHEIDRDILRKALSETAKKRHSDDLIPPVSEHCGTGCKEYSYAAALENISARL